MTDTGRGPTRRDRGYGRALTRAAPNDAARVTEEMRVLPLLEAAAGARRHLDGLRPQVRRSLLVLAVYCPASGGRPCRLVEAYRLRNGVVAQFPARPRVEAHMLTDGACVGEHQLPAVICSHGRANLSGDWLRGQLPAEGAASRRVAVPAEVWRAGSA